MFRWRLVYTKYVLRQSVWHCRSSSFLYLGCFLSDGFFNHGLGLCWCGSSCNCNRWFSYWSSLKVVNKADTSQLSQVAAPQNGLLDPKVSARAALELGS